jgi:SAM-dependent MidA family methyltransferase
VLTAGPLCAQAGALRYVAVEVSATQRAMHPAGVESTATMPKEPFEGVIIANELLDNLPFRLCVFDGGWREAFVARSQGRAVEVLSAPLDPLPPVLAAQASHGARAPLQDEAALWVRDALGSLRAGSLLVFDYARATTAEFAALGWREWLRTYCGHNRGGHYLSDPGTQDITCDVAVDQLPEPDAIRSQAQFLQLWGIDELVEQGRRGWETGAAGGGLNALKMRSRITEAQALLDPSGLGGFWAIEWQAAKA